MSCHMHVAYTCMHTLEVGDLQCQSPHPLTRNGCNLCMKAPVDFYVSHSETNVMVYTVFLIRQPYTMSDEETKESDAKTL